ncbi:MAG TPA: glutamate racemase [Clostridia bacterium]|nr:glutamate racemase [Clostridia bacterium]
MIDRELPVGVFDSGVGGVSVLASLLRLLPEERFIYYADSGNAPYGTKDVSEVARLSLNAADFLVSKGIKALVVACNTATSAAIGILREIFSFPVVGMEPALKPAVSLSKEGNILVMATPVTLRERKFHQLLSRYEDTDRIISLPCPGLVELIEAGIVEGKIMEDFLQGLFASIELSRVGTVVLGCTHYLFIKKEIASVLGNSIPILDGNLGTARQVRRLLADQSLLSDQGGLDYPQEKRVQWFASGDEKKVTGLCRQLLKNLGD